MRDDPPIRALEELRDELQRAVESQAPQQTAPRPRRRGRRRGLIIVASVLVGAGAVAGAAQLISTGESVKRSDKPERYRPGPLGATIVATAPDPGAGYTWGVAAYTSRDGDDCAIAGQIVGSRLGVIRDDTFYPYAASTGGFCGDVDALPLVADVRVVETDRGPRSLVYGRVSPTVKAVKAVHDSDAATTNAADGAFLFVYDGRLGPADVNVKPL